MFVEAHEQIGSTNLVECGMLHCLCNGHGIIPNAKPTTPLVHGILGSQYETADLLLVC